MYHKEHHTTLLLRPDRAACEALEATFQAFAEATTAAIQAGRRAHTTSNALIHRLCYRQLRNAFGLNANLAVKAIAQAALYLKAPPSTTLPPLIHYDARTLRVVDAGHAVSLSTVQGRLKEVALRQPTPVTSHDLQHSHVLRGLLLRDQPNRYALDLTFRLPRFARSPVVSDGGPLRPF